MRALVVLRAAAALSLASLAGLVGACASDGAGADPAQGDAGSADGAAPVGETHFGDAACTDGFCWVRPTPQGNALHAVTAFADGEAWAVGVGGAVLRRREGKWRAAAPVTTSTLRAVFGTGRDDVWMVGGTGTVLHFDGKRLEKRESGTTANLRGVTGFSRSDVWIVGEGGTILHWDGKAIVPVPGGTDDLHAVWGSGPSDVWAVGGTFNVGTRAHYDGSTWKATSSGLSGAGWNAISGTSGNDIWLAGNDGRASHYDGTAWKDHYSVLGSGDATTVAAFSPNEVYFGTGTALHSYYDGKFESYPIESGNALTRDASGELLFVGAGGRITRGTEENAVNEVEASREEILAVTPDEHVLVRRGTGTKDDRVVDLTAGTTLPLPEPTTVTIAEDGTPIQFGRDSLHYLSSTAFSYAENGKWTAVPTPGAALPTGPTGARWDHTLPLAARSKDDVWFVGVEQAPSRGDRSAGALLHYVRGTYTSIPLPRECVGPASNSLDYFLGAFRPVADGGILACDCLAARVRTASLDAPTRWTCAPPVDGYTTLQKEHGLYLDGDAILVTRVDSLAAGERGGFNAYRNVPVVDRVAGGKHERLVLPEGLVSLDYASLTIERSPLGKPWIFFGEAEGRTANLLEVDGTKVTARNVPVGTIAAAYPTKGGLYVSNGTGLLKTQ